MVSAVGSPGRRSLRRALATSVLILAFYYVVPVDPGLTGTHLALRVVGTIVAGLLITWLIVRQISHHIAVPERASLVSLLIAIVAGVVFFALADYAIAISGPGQFAELSTKTDALYFALVTLTTVGYGDIHPTGQIGRAVVAVQLVFNVAVLATSASLLFRQLSSRARTRLTTPPAEDPPADQG